MLLIANGLLVTNVHGRLPVQGLRIMFQLTYQVQLILLLLGTLYSITGCAAEEEEEFLSQRSGSMNAVESSVAMISTPSTAPSTELLDALAHTVIERNAIASQRDSLLQQRWLIVAYAMMTSLVVGWFIRASLLRHSGSAIKEDRVVKPVDAATRKRPNATITIRNGTTQQPEIIERVATRRLFKSRPESEATAQVAPASVKVAKPILGAATTVTHVTPPVVIKPAVPVIVAVEKSAAGIPVRSNPPSDYDPTDTTPTHLVIGNRPSILLSPEIDDALPETTQVRIARSGGWVLARQGFSLLEVMIALAILATVLASIAGGIVSLTSAKRYASEESAVSNVMRMWTERIMGGDWEWLGRDRSEDPLRGAWSWQRPENDGPLAKGEFPPLQEGAKNLKYDAAIQVLGTEKSGLADLHLYLEYYQPIALELCFTPIDGAAARSTWAETRNAYRLIPPIDLRKQINGVVVRLLATWTSLNGGTRRRELVFARIK